MLATAYPVHWVLKAEFIQTVKGDDHHRCCIALILGWACTRLDDSPRWSGGSPQGWTVNQRHRPRTRGQQLWRRQDLHLPTQPEPSPTQPQLLPHQSPHTEVPSKI